MYNIKYILQICTTSVLTETPQSLQTAVNLYRCNLQKRYFFGILGKKKEYYGRKLVGYSSEQMFDVVADVKNYKHFVPFCKKSYIIWEGPDFLKAALEIGFPPVVESYTSKVTFAKPYFVKAVCFDGKLFEHLITTWKFNPGLKSNKNSCIVDFSIDFEFKSVLHSNLAHMFFDKVVKQMEGAFLVEAKRRYGPESLPSHPLIVTKS